MTDPNDDDIVVNPDVEPEGEELPDVKNDVVQDDAEGEPDAGDPPTDAMTEG